MKNANKDEKIGKGVKKGQKKKHDIDMKEFSKHVKPFEWYGPQRDLSPEMKRIVKNLVC